MTLIVGWLPKTLVFLSFSSNETEIPLFLPFPTFPSTTPSKASKRLPLLFAELQFENWISPTRWTFASQMLPRFHFFLENPSDTSDLPERTRNSSKTGLRCEETAFSLDFELPKNLPPSPLCSGTYSEQSWRVCEYRTASFFDTHTDLIEFLRCLFPRPPHKY